MQQKPKKRALGRGLSALLEGAEGALQHEHVSANETTETASPGSVSFISTNLIEVNPYQPRTHFEEEALADLSASIKTYGIIQPITLREIEPGKYQIISGERRFRASLMAGFDKIPAYVRKADDQEMLGMALVENIQRENLDAVEIALSYQRLIDELNYTQEELSEKIGKNRSTVTNYLRLLKLQPEIQLGIRRKLISMGHARALVAVDDADVQLQLFEDILVHGWSVRQVEDAVRALFDQAVEDEKPKRGRRKAEKTLSDSDLKVKHKMEAFFQAPVEVKRKADGKGRVEIIFKNAQELERIIQLLGN
ncbi:MAG: ParB/RepB/Spo0J family partition protein [Luteibaculaceae bacterium]